jgi:hypothetical protein
MKAKKQKNGIKVLLSLVIAIAMIGIPASVFTATATDNESGHPLLVLRLILFLVSSKGSCMCTIPQTG